MLANPTIGRRGESIPHKLEKSLVVILDLDVDLKGV